MRITAHGTPHVRCKIRVGDAVKSAEEVHDYRATNNGLSTNKSCLDIELCIHLTPVLTSFDYR